MSSVGKSSAIRQFIIQNVAKHPRNIAGVTAERFEVTHQAINHHLRKLATEGVVRAQGNTRARRYELAANKVEFGISLGGHVEEDVIWREKVAPLIGDLPQNVRGICQYGFTEMVNNVIDHSEGSKCNITIVQSAASVEIWIFDDGVGIFRKIKRAFGLKTESDALLELVKGKVTTDPSRHTGEGIYFSSRMFDSFRILSGGIFYCHMADIGDWLMEYISRKRGTMIQMTLDTSTSRTEDEVFERFARPDEFSFSVTHVPVALAKRGDENLISRSQAKRLVRGFERFEEVLLDFSEVTSIGQAFADEVFRVFQLDHPEVKLAWINATPAVERMISRARHKLKEASGG